LDSWDLQANHHQHVQNQSTTVIRPDHPDHRTVRVVSIVRLINRSGEKSMPSVTVTIDPAHHRDVAMCAEARGWLHHMTRSAWTVEETVEDEDDDDEAPKGRNTTLTFSFKDHLDAMDFYAWRGLCGRGRRS
jgi:hypothetical protein